MLREVHVPISPASKKIQAIDMAHKLLKKKHKSPVPLEKVTVKTDHECDSERLDMWIEDSVIRSPQRDFPLKTNFEAIGDPDVNVNVSNMDTKINWSAHPPTSIPEKTLATPSRVSHNMSKTEKVRTPDIPMNLSDKDTCKHG